MKPLLLDLFCGAGGCTRGYQTAGFEVHGVDHMPQPRYIGERFFRADALEYMERWGSLYDFIHASPPCQFFAGFTRMNRRRGIFAKHVNLIPQIREALQATAALYVIENIEPARRALLSPMRLCGSSFGLAVRRHRLFETNALLSPLACAHVSQGQALGVYGTPGSAPMRPTKYGGGYVRARDAEEAGRAMGIDWMTYHELTQAIPPAYTEHIGTQLLWHREGAVSATCAHLRVE